MSHSARGASAFAVGVAALALMRGPAVKAQILSNPYHINFNWDKLQGRKIGVASGIKIDPDGKHIWLLDRCGANGCAESDLDPIIQADLDGKLVKSFGKGVMNFPHGFFIDKEGNVWVTDGAPAGDPRGAAGFKKHMGHQVYKFSPDGKLLMTVGEVSLTHATAHARVAIWEMVRGRYRNDFWMGTLLSFVGGLLSWLALFGVVNISIGVAGAPMALIGLMLFENAYVQAGQSVPLA